MNKRFLSTGLASMCLVAVLTIATPRAEASFGDFLRSIFGRGGQEAAVMRAETTTTTKQVAPAPTTNRGTISTTNTAPVNPTGTGLIVQCNGNSASAISLCEEICLESGGTPDSSGTTGNCLVASLSSVPGNIFNGATGAVYQAKPTITKPAATVTSETKPTNPAVVTTTPKSLCGANSLCLGMKTPAVKAMQQKLVTLKYLASADGSFGPATEKAVKAFQTKKGMTADGIVGPKTLQRMDDDVVALTGGRIDPNDGTGPYNPITYDKKLKPIRKIFNILGLASINTTPTDLNPTGINPSTSVWVPCSGSGLACQSAGGACYGYPIVNVGGSGESASWGCNVNQVSGTSFGFTDFPVSFDPGAMVIGCGPNTFFTCGELQELCIGEGGEYESDGEIGVCEL